MRNGWIGCRSVATPPARTPTHRPIQFKRSHKSSLRLLQFNCNGLSPKLDEIVDYMVRHYIVLAAIQETKFTARSTITSKGSFNIIRQDRAKNKGGGLAFIVHNTLPHRSISIPPSHPDPHPEQQSIVIRAVNKDFTITNVYIPPNSSCASGYLASIAHLLQTQDHIILGDFNAHHPLWFSNISPDARGEDLAAEIDSSDYCVLNEDLATRVTASSLSSPDVSLASSSLIPLIDWHTEIALNSDHLPISLEINCTTDQMDRTEPSPTSTKPTGVSLRTIAT